MNIIEKLNKELKNLTSIYEEIDYKGLRLGDLVIPLMHGERYERFSQPVYYVMCERDVDGERCVWVYSPVINGILPVAVQGGIEVHLF